MKPKICLINPPTTAIDAETFFPMALVALGSYLRKRGIPLEIVDFDLDLRKNYSLFKWDNFKKHALERLEKTEAQIFGISTICSSYPVTLLLTQEMRKKWPSSKIILGGHQPSAVSEETLRVCPWIDVIAIGEGEKTLLELLSSDWQPSSLNKIAGIAFRDGEQVIRTPKRELIDDLDILPLPDLSLVPISEYVPLFQEPAFIEAGRGCPFLCSFCSTSLMWQRKYRAKSPALILEEMYKLKNDYGMKNRCLALTHDNFTTYRPYVIEFCDYFKKHNKEGLLWSVSARPDTVNAHLIRELHAAGCRGLFFGVDTGSLRMQKVIHKHLNLEHFEKVLRETVRLNISATVSLIVGYPEETETDLNETLYLAIHSKLMGAFKIQIHHLSPLAGTPIFEENRRNLFYHPKQSTDISSNPFESSELENLILSKKELFSSFYTIPTPLLGSTDLGALAIFYSSMIHYMVPFLSTLLNSTGWTPVELFQNWMIWLKKHYPEERMNWRLPLNTIDEFMNTHPRSSRKETTVEEEAEFIHESA